MDTTALTAQAAPSVLWGLKLYELLTLAGIVIGPITAVAISLWFEQRKRTREARTQILRMLINTRGMPSDPAYSIAINLIPVEFNGHKAVMQAWRNYIESVRYDPTPENAAPHEQKLTANQVSMIYQIMKSLNLGLSESDIQTEGYLARGFTTRDNLYLDSLRAMREIADASTKSATATERLLANNDASTRGI